MLSWVAITFLAVKALVWRQIASVVIVRTQKIFSGLLLPAVEQHRAVHRNKNWHQLKEFSQDALHECTSDY